MRALRRKPGLFDTSQIFAALKSAGLSSPSWRGPLMPAGHST